MLKPKTEPENQTKTKVGSLIFVTHHQKTLNQPNLQSSVRIFLLVSFNEHNDTLE